MKLYLENGYFNMQGMIDEGYPFNFCIGGRGTGKTYGMAEAIINPTFKNDIYKRRVYMRRTQAELDLLNNAELSPFKKFDMNNNTNTDFPVISKNIKGIMTDGAPKGITLALSTIRNVRGFDGSDIDILFYDEFIPEKTALPMRGEAEAFSQAYETINRNRELEGYDPLQVISCANANRADNPIFIDWGLVKPVERMKRDRRSIWADDKRGILIVNLEHSPISKAKADTALYRATRGSDFEKMSLSNDFAFDDFSNIDSKKLIEYKPLIEIGEICIYKHKSRSEYYISEHTSGTPDHYGVTERELKAFKRNCWRIWTAYIDGRVFFENYLTKALYLRYNK